MKDLSSMIKEISEEVEVMRIEMDILGLSDREKEVFQLGWNYSGTYVREHYDLTRKPVPDPTIIIHKPRRSRNK